MATLPSKNASGAHPLDGCDEDEIYKVMMSERTELVKARREAEDAVVKTIIQISSALVALIAGFISQANVHIGQGLAKYLVFVVVALICALTVGLLEQYLSSKAYEAQQKLVEDYHQKKIAEFDEPRENGWVRRCQKVAFVAFVVGLILLGLFAFLQSEASSNDQTATTTTATTTAATATATATAATATATATAAANGKK
jgi:uncharacterized membrane-anchored protein YhcB (DUF1043 family)